MSIAYPTPAPDPAGEPASAPPAPPPTETKPPLWRRIPGLLIVVVFVALKWGKALLLLLTKAKFLASSATMLVSIAAYSLLWGWKFALGFVLLLLVHEFGHVIQLRREGIPASAPMFIPFLGAVVMAKSLGDNASAEARVGLAGPILGTLGALAVALVAVATDGDFWYALAFTGLFLNLFNLMPVTPLDGGRAMAALSPKMWFVGLAAMALLAFMYPNPVIFLILLLGAFDTYRRWKARKSGDPAVLRYYDVPPAHRVAVFAVYIGLIAVCAIGMDLTFIERDIPS